jgi:hypothetical protein
VDGIQIAVVKCLTTFPRFENLHLIETLRITKFEVAVTSNDQADARKWMNRPSSHRWMEKSQALNRANPHYAPKQFLIEAPSLHWNRENNGSEERSIQSNEWIFTLWNVKIGRNLVKNIFNQISLGSENDGRPRPLPSGAAPVVQCQK